jgi:hypothetical protein
VGYEQIRVTEELSRNVQRWVGVSPRNYETLGELVKGIAAERWVQEPANLISEEPTRHEVRVDGRVLHTICFVDAHMLPFVLEEGAIEVRSDSPTGGGSLCVRHRGRRGRFVTRGGRLVRRGQGRGRDGLRNAMPLPERISLTCRLRALGRADVGGRHRRPLAAGSVRTSPRLDLGSIRRSRRRALLLSDRSRKRSEELP